MNLGFCFVQCSDVNLKILNNFIFEILFCPAKSKKTILHESEQSKYTEYTYPSSLMSYLYA